MLASERVFGFHDLVVSVVLAVSGSGGAVISQNSAMPTGYNQFIGFFIDALWLAVAYSFSSQGHITTMICS